jgi:hypothetical protein
MVSLDSTLTRTEEQISVATGEEIVVLNAKTGIYFSMEEIGVRIWQLLENPIRVRAIYDRLIDEYHVEPVQCEQDLLSFLSDLSEQGLITEVQDS